MKKILLLLAFLLSVGIVCAQETALTSDGNSKYTPMWSPDDTTILYTYQDLVDLQIGTVTTAGVQTNLTTDATDLYFKDFPVWSPDGADVAFQKVNGTKYQIFKMDVGSQVQTRLTSNTAYDHNRAEYNPAGTLIAYYIDPTFANNNQIAVVSSAGGAETNLTSKAYDHEVPRWNNAGTRLVYEAYSSLAGNIQIGIVDSNGANETNLTSFAEDHEVPQWSPDDAWVVYSRYNSTSNNYELWKVPSAGGAEVQILADPSFSLYNPQWSSDGSTILYVKTDWATGAIYTVSSSGGVPTSIISDAFDNQVPQYNSDDSRIAFTKNDATGFNQVYDYLFGNGGPVPEFSTVALILAVLVGLAGIFVVRRKP